jgi:secreted Zn-dependent insulinase-like peptidase
MPNCIKIQGIVFEMWVQMGRPTPQCIHIIYISQLQHTVKSNTNPCTCVDRPIEFQEVEALRFEENQHKKVVSLSALPPGNIPGTHFC